MAALQLLPQRVLSILRSYKSGLFFLKFRFFLLVILLILFVMTMMVLSFLFLFFFTNLSFIYPYISIPAVISDDSDQVVVTKKVEEGVTLEICVGKFWSSVGEVAVDVCVEFWGVGVSCGETLFLNGGDQLARFDVVSFLLSLFILIFVMIIFFCSEQNN